MIGFLSVTPTPPPTPGGQEGPDLLTIVISIVVGAVSGVLGAIITSRSQRKIAAEAARERAEQALWGFQRALSDYASEAEGSWIKDADYFTSTSREKLEAARQAAYPFRRYLEKDQRRKLLGRNWFVQDNPVGDPLAPANDVFEWAAELERQLDKKFGG